jgi:hypothetical protein
VAELLEEVVLHRPEGVEAHPVAEHRLLEGVLERGVLALAVPGPRDRDLVEQRELQDFLPP